MPNLTRQQTLEALKVIPGVGHRVAADLWNLGLRSVSDLKGRDPEALYEQLCEFQGKQIDRCMLYTLRCAVYFASNERHEPDLLKWWNWSDKCDELQEHTRARSG